MVRNQILIGILSMNQCNRFVKYGLLHAFCIVYECATFNGKKHKQKQTHRGSDTHAQHKSDVYIGACLAVGIAIKLTCRFYDERIHQIDLLLNARGFCLRERNTNVPCTTVIYVCVCVWVWVCLSFCCYISFLIRPMELCMKKQSLLKYSCFKLAIN